MNFPAYFLRESISVCLYVFGENHLELILICIGKVLRRSKIQWNIFSSFFSTTFIKARAILDNRFSSRKTMLVSIERVISDIFISFKMPCESSFSTADLTMKDAPSPLSRSSLMNSRLLASNNIIGERFIFFNISITICRVTDPSSLMTRGMLASSFVVMGDRLASK